MKFNEITKEDAELLSYTDLANIVLDEQRKLSTANLFKIITDKLGLSKKAYENKIGNFYTSLTTDTRFILLENGDWDLMKNHKIKAVIAPDALEEEDIEIEDYDDIVIDEEETEENYLDKAEEDDTNDVAEEYKDLVIIDEEDLDTMI